MSILLTNVSRRDALKTLGMATGFVLSTSVVPRGLRALVAAQRLVDPLSPSVYLAIDEDGIVRVFVHRVEMGQGTRTGLTQIVADELEADWSRLEVVPAYGDKKFGSQNTDGSSSIRGFYDAFRTAGATARTMLEQAAAGPLGRRPRARWRPAATRSTTGPRGSAGLREHWWPRPRCCTCRTRSPSRSSPAPSTTSSASR